MTAYKCAVEIQKQNLGITFPSASQGEGAGGEVQFGESDKSFNKLTSELSVCSRKSH